MIDVINWLSLHVLQEDYYQFYVILAIALVYFEWKFHSLRKWFIND